ncbi:unnamed protein product, partial [Closterium sp. Naga37s-1]
TLNSSGLSGSIPKDIFTLSSLESLDLSHNYLNGSVPQSVGSAIQVTSLDLSGNNLEGSIPPTLGLLTNLASLHLGNNALDGTLPMELTFLSAISYLNMTGNRLRGRIPGGISRLSELAFLDLSANQLDGLIPLSIGNLSSLVELNLSSNTLAGSIPNRLYGLSSLRSLSLSGNLLSGSLSSSVASLAAMQALYLGQNNFTGSIPPVLGRLTNLTLLSFDQSGLSCPTAGTADCAVNHTASTGFCQACADFCSPCIDISGSSSRSGSAANPPSTNPPPEPPLAPESNPPSPPSSASSSLSTGAIAGIAVAVVLLLVVVVLLVMHARGALPCLQHGDGTRSGGGFFKGGYRRRSRSRSSHISAESAAADTSPQVCQRYSLADMARATANWSDRNLIGSGGFGDVYRGVCPSDPNVVWAVKRARVLTKDFQREVNAMASKHHPNLVRLLGFCIDFNADTEEMEQVVVYEFMENGDLDRWIGDEAPKPLSLLERVDILIGAAHGLEHLHLRRLKSLHHYLLPTFTSLPSPIRGTEAALPARACGHSHRFGVVMLAVITAQHAVRTQQDTSRVNLKAWVAPLVSAHDVASFKDPRLEGPADVILRLAELALSCTAMPTASRPDMMRIIGGLKAMRAELTGGDVDERAIRIDSELAIGVGETLEEQIMRVESMGDGDRGGLNEDTPDVPVLLDCQALWIRNFTGWTTGEDCATAEGLQCDSNGMIVKMSMEMSSLAGVLPSSIGNLTLLTHLNFFQNNLDSDIPTTFGALTNLQHLNLGINMLTGPLPLFLDTLSLLTFLNLGDNKLTGTLSAGLGNLKQLQFLDLSKNNVSASLPSTLGSLSTLTWLDLQYNALENSIPSSITNLTGLTYLNLASNKLNGSVPVFDGFPALTYLGLGGNSLQGTFPVTGNQALPLKTLDLRGNKLAGSIPRSISSLSALEHLLLSENRFNGFIPDSIMNLVSLEYLGMGVNRLQGPVPSTMGNLVKLTALNMSGNRMAGILPATLGSLTKLTLLDYDRNFLSCPTDGNCVVSQKSTTAFCKSCPTFCAPCYGKG